MRNDDNGESVTRDKRAQGIAAMGLVTRKGEVFKVREPSLRRRPTTHDVWRDEGGKIRCTCAPFNQESRSDPNYRCVHQLAVKHHLLRKTSTKSTATHAGPAADADVLSSELKPTTHAEGNEPMNSGAPQTTAGGGKEDAAPVVPLSFASTLRTLRQPVDPRLVKTREGWRDRSGNQHMVEYVEWTTVADILDRVAPAWSHSVRGVQQIGETAVVTAAITIDGVTREGVGTGSAGNETGIKKAEHDALKRAAVKFGIARELYQREGRESGGQAGNSPRRDYPRDPQAKSMADLVTPKQLGMIRALAREAGVDPDEECRQQTRLRTEELSKRAASVFIDHLKGLQSGGGAASGLRRAS